MTTTYLDTEDICNELGITRRQLGYWVQQGLVYPTRPGKYTEADVAHIARIRDLVVGWRLPVDFVKRVMDDPQVVMQTLANLVAK